MNNPMIGPQKGPGVSEVFNFQPYQFVRHPVFEQYCAFWQESCLDINLPFGGAERFWLAQMPMNTWVGLQDAAGRQIPLCVCVDYRGALQGIWLGDASTQTGTNQSHASWAEAGGSWGNQPSTASRGPSTLGSLNEVFAAREQEIQEIGRTDPHLAALLQKQHESEVSAALKTITDLGHQARMNIWKK